MPSRGAPAGPTVVYRVYESYHESDESGTHEYGTYTTLEKAKQRIAEVWERRGYGSDYAELPSGSRMGRGLGAPIVRFDTITLDLPTEEDNVGYT